MLVPSDFWAAFPLYLCYWVFPAAMLLARSVGLDLPRNAIDGVWLAYAAAGAAHLAFARTERGHMAGIRLTAALFCATVALLLLRFAWPVMQPGFMAVPWAMELKPFLYMLVAGTGLAAFGRPSESHFLACGKGLALIVLCEFLFTWLRTGQMLRPQGSGEVNYDAVLLAVSLCFCLTFRRASPVWLLVLGIMATLSRTSILAAAGMLLLFGPFGWSRRFFFVCLAAGGLCLSFWVRGLPGALDALDRLWMWQAAGSFALASPVEAMTGFWPGLALPLPVPAQLSFLWSMQAGEWGITGVHPYNLHGFWLRMAATWGVGTAALSAAALCWAMIVAKGNAVRSLSMLCIAAGMTMGLVYCSNVAVPLLLAFVVSVRSTPRPVRLQKTCLQIPLNVIEGI